MSPLDPVAEIAVIPEFCRSASVMGMLLEAGGLPFGDVCSVGLGGKVEPADTVRLEAPG